MKKVGMGLLGISVLLVGWTTERPEVSHRSFHAIEKLIGSWSVTVDLGVPGAPLIRGLMTFDAGGGLTETNTLLHANSAAMDPFCACNGSDGHGAWKRTGLDSFVFTFRKLVYASERTADFLPVLDLTEPFIGAGQHIGYAVIQDADVSVDGDTFVANTIGNLFNLDDEPLIPGFGPVAPTVTGRRIEAE